MSAAPFVSAPVSTGDLAIGPASLAEVRALQMLQCETSVSQIQELVELLDSEIPARGQCLEGEFSWSSGAYVHGTLVGLRKHAKTHPLCTKVLCRYLTHVMPEFEFTTVALFQNLLTPPHRDANNAPGFPNALLPCSDFQGGELWVGSDLGSSPCPDPALEALGFRLPLDRPVLFDAHQLHATCAWTGQRLVLAGFSIRHFEKLALPDRECLLELGFSLPRMCTGDFCLSSEPACPLPQGLPRPLQSACPVVFEVFCGTARVTRALRTQGWRYAQGIDHVEHAEASGLMLLADLTTAEGQGRLRFWMQCPYLVGIFFAPPCGTASLARLIPVVNEWGQTLPSPRPLRSSSCPEGLPDLCGPDLRRVNLANSLYTLTADVCEAAAARGLMAAVENPRNSLFWQTKAGLRAQAHCPLTSVLQNCAFGGPRPKFTRVAHNHPAFFSLCKLCPGENCARRHLPWGRAASGRWATSEETAYPPALASAIADCFRRGVEVSAPVEPSLHAIRATSGSQPKASKMPPLVSEHVMRGPPAALSRLPVQPMQRLDRPWSPPAGVMPQVELPAGAQLLRDTPIAVKLGSHQGSHSSPKASPKPDAFLGSSLQKLPDVSGYRPVSRPDLELDTVPAPGLVGAEAQLNLNGTTDHAHLKEVAWGIPRSPEAFVKAAAEAGHPKLFDALLPSVLGDAVKVNASLACEELASSRAAFFKKWTAKAVELASQEAELKASMPEHRRRVVESKRLLLWECMLQEYGYPDLEVVSLMKQGVSLTGQVPVSGVFEPVFAPAQLTPEQLHAHSASSRRNVLAEVSNPSALDDVILDKTETETEKGWVSGDLSLESLRPGAIINKRFAIMQHDKPRVIDDCSGSPC